MMVAVVGLLVHADKHQLTLQELLNVEEVGV